MVKYILRGPTKNQVKEFIQKAGREARLRRIFLELLGAKLDRLEKNEENFQEHSCCPFKNTSASA